MSGDVTNIVRSVQLGRNENIVIIELHCSDDLAAVVMLEDIGQKITSDRGLQLTLRGNVVAEGARS